MAWFCFYKCLASILQLLAQFLRLLLFLSFPFGMKKKKRLWIGTQLLVLESVVCLFVLDCFGVTGKLQEYIQ